MKALLYGGLALAGLLCLTHKPNDITTPKPATVPPVVPPAIVPAVPPAVVKAVNDALATLDPAAINTAASALDAQGFHQQAQDLRAAATSIKNAMNRAG